METVTATYKEDFSGFQLEGQLLLRRSIIETSGLDLNNFSVHDFIMLMQI